MLTCNQQPKCDNPPAFRFTWPGNEEACICLIHAIALRNVAAAIQLHVQLIPLTVDDWMKSDDATHPAPATEGERK